LGCGTPLIEPHFPAARSFTVTRQTKTSSKSSLIKCKDSSVDCFNLKPITGSRIEQIEFEKENMSAKLSDLWATKAMFKRTATGMLVQICTQWTGGSVYTKDGSRCMMHVVLI
jgi:hypothetical protein